MQVIQSPSATFLSKIFIDEVAELILRYEEIIFLDFQVILKSLLTHVSAKVWLNQRMNVSDLRSLCARCVPTYGANPASNLRLIVSSPTGRAVTISKQTPGNQSISTLEIDEGSTIYILIQFF